MPSQLPRLICRTNQETIDKFRYIADDNFRTMNRELEMLVIQHIQQYEAAHGPIKIVSSEKT